MFLDWCAQLGLLEHAADKNVLKDYPVAARAVIVSEVNDFLLDGSVARRVIKTHMHALWNIEVVGQGFGLPIQEHSTIRNSIELYKRWLTYPDERPPPIAAEIQFFMQQFFQHFSLLFEPRKGDAAVHAELCGSVLSLFDHMSDGMAQDMEPDTWEMLLKIVLGVVDSLFSSDSPKPNTDLARLLSHQLMSVMFLTFLRAAILDMCPPELWQAFTRAAPLWISWLPFIVQWSATINAISQRVLNQLYGPTCGTETVTISANGSTTELEMGGPALLHAFYRFLYLPGNPNNITNPNIFRTALEGLSKVVDSLLTVGTTYVGPDGYTHPQIGPNGSTILTILGPWLFEAVLNQKNQFIKGNAIAMSALCRIFIKRGMPAFPPERLAQFYESVKMSLEGHGDMICAVLVSARYLFTCDHLEGSTVLIPYFLTALDRLLATPEGDFTLSLPRDVVRRAGITIIGTLISFPNAYGTTEFAGAAEINERDQRPANFPRLVVSYDDARPRFISLLLKAIHYEDNQQNLQLILWTLGVNLYENLYSSKELPFRSVHAIQSGIGNDAWDNETTLTAFRVLESLAEIVTEIAGINVYTVRSLLTALCGFINSRASQPDLDAETVRVVVGAFSCIRAWCFWDMWILNDSEALKVLINTLDKTLGTTTPANYNLSAPSGRDHIRLAAHGILDAILCAPPYPNHVGPSAVSSVVVENDVLPNGDNEYCRVFCIGGSTILSVVERPIPDKGPAVSMLIRTSSGRVLWNCELLYSPLMQENNQTGPVSFPDQPNSCIMGEWAAKAHPPPDADAALTSPDLRKAHEFIRSVTQTQIELERMSVDNFFTSDLFDVSLPPATLPLGYNNPCKFLAGRLLMSHLHFFDNQERTRVFVLSDTPELRGQLRRLDSIPQRVCHSIAVLNVRPRQYRLKDILTNTGGSAEYQGLLCGLGWPVQLDQHPGSAGKIDTQLFPSTLYHSTATDELIFHVATDMEIPTSRHERHRFSLLGASSVVIVWAETEDDVDPPVVDGNNVLFIFIHPLQSRPAMFRTRVVSLRPDLAKVGPLITGMVVGAASLATLVRLTALTAARMIHNDPNQPLRARLQAIKEVSGMKRLLSPAMFYSSLFTPQEGEAGSAGDSGD